MENNKIVCYGARDILIYMASVLEVETHSIQMYDVEVCFNYFLPCLNRKNCNLLIKLF